MADTDPRAAGLLGIGAFSSLVRLSVRMLRYYDKQGVLSPAHIDPDTGYRYYSGDQVADAVLVRSLRDVGFSVSAIAAAVSGPRDPQTLRRALEAQRSELLAEVAQVHRRLAELAHLAEQLTEVPMTDISITTIPVTTILALRGIVPSYDQQDRLWERFVPMAQRYELPARPQSGGTTYFDDGYEEADVDIEAWVPLDAPITVEEPLICRQIPAHQAAVATVHGDYAGIARASADLARFLAREGRVKSGPISHVYVVGREQTTNAADFVTEIRMPV
jgi:DNA-binding transcriptional MerR regulator